MAIKTFRDIYTDLAHRMKLDLTKTDEKSDIKNWVNIAYRDFQKRSSWYWKKRSGSFQVEPVYKTGTT